MQTFSKRFLALLLTLCMLASFAPIGVLAAQASAEVVDRQLMLGDDLTMHFYVKTEVANATATISVDGTVRESYSISGMTAGEKGYDLSVDLAAAEMTGKIILTVNDGENQLLSETYSVQEYAHYLLENNYADETKALVKEMLNYGAKAQLYFDHNTESLANAKYPAETFAQIGTQVPDVVISDTISGVDFYGASMVMQSKIAMRFYFTGSAEGLTFSHGTPVQTEDKFYIEVANITPDQMENALNVSVTGNGGEITFSYSPMDYITRMYNKDSSSTELKAMLLAAKGYFDAAKVFAGVAENRTGSMSMQYRYGAAKLIQINTNLPSDTPCVNFTASDNGCSIDQSANQYQQFGWVGMDNVDGTIVLTFHFNADFEAGQTYVLPKGAVFGFADKSKYTLDKNYTFTFDGSGWTMEAKEPAVSLSYRYGTGSLIQYNSDLPASVPCANFTADQNGCAFIQSGNQSVGWIGMEAVNGVTVLTFHFNSAYAVGESYTLSAGSVFGFTDGSIYELAADITLYWDGASWVSEPPVVQPKVLNFLQYSYGTSTLIQVKTDLPSNVPCNSFLATDNGCSIDQSANKYQQVGWMGMVQGEDSSIYLSFNFGSAFEDGQTYVLPKGAVFGFADGSKYVLDKNYTFTFDGNNWAITNPEDPMTLAYRWGAAKVIQYNTDLPVEAMGADFLANANGCALLQSGDQQVGYISMANADGTVILSFNFNSEFTLGQSYTLAAGSVFGFENGSKYELFEDITLYWNGSEWTAEAPVIEKPVSFQYRYGAAKLIQLNTTISSNTPCVNFTAGDNGCSIDQSANLYQQFGWVGMDNVDGTIVLTFHFNNAFEAGQTYVLPKGAVFGFTDGSKYILDKNYEFIFDGSSWTMAAREDQITLDYRYGAAKLIQFNTNLPEAVPSVNFTADQNGCAFIQSGDQSVGWIGMEAVDGVTVLTFHFNAAYEIGQSYTLSAGSVFGFTDGSFYELYEDITLYWNGTQWSAEAPAPEVKNIALTYRWGNGSIIQYNTDLPATTPCANFLAADNGCDLKQNANQYQQVAWIGMENVGGVIVLTFHFGSEFVVGQNYILSAESVFGFTDGSSYTLENDVNLYWDGTNWSTMQPITLTYRYGVGSSIMYNTNLPQSAKSANFLSGKEGCSISQSGNQQVGWFSMGIDDAGVVYLSANFTSAFTYGQSYTLGAGSVFTFDDGSSYKLYQDVTLYWDGSQWSTEAPADILDESNFTGGEVITFADLPVDAKDTNKIEEYKALGFNTSLLTEDHTGAQGPDKRYTVSVETANAPENGLNFAYRWGNNNTLQVNTNLPASTPIANFTADQNGCSIDQSGNTVQWVGWIGMANADGTIVLTFNFNKAFEAGQSYVLPKGAVFGFTDGSTYTLDADYTFTFDGSNWSMNASTLNLSLSAGAAKYIQLKTNIPTGLTYGNFLLGDTTTGHNVILETTDGAQAVAWFTYSELSGAVYLTFNFTGYNKPGTQYILKAGTSLKAGNNVYTTDRDYILTVNNDYLTSLENLDRAGLNVWIRNYRNTADYFTDDLTSTLKLYQDVIDGFYMIDEMFQTEALMAASGQTATSHFGAMEAVKDWFNQNFADKYFHINHVPLSSWDHYTSVNGAALSAIDVAGYRNFLAIYKQNFNDQLTNASGASVSFDNYPFVHDQGKYGGFFGIGGTFESGIQDTYLLNCLIAAQVANEDDFGLCIQTFNATDLKNKTSRDIASAAEVSLQLYTGFAMGADLFEYFAYNSNDDFNAIMNQDGSKRIYDLVKKGNQALCFADVVNSFAWNGIVTSAGSVNNHNDDAFDSVADMVLTNSSNGVLDSYSSTDDAIIGCFTKDSLNGYMLVNYNDPAAVTGNNSVTVTFENCTRARVYTEIDGVLTSQIVDLTNGSYTAILAPGAGCFIIPA